MLAGKHLPAVEHTAYGVKEEVGGVAEDSGAVAHEVVDELVAVNVVESGALAVVEEQGHREFAAAVVAADATREGVTGPFVEFNGLLEIHI